MKDYKGYVNKYIELLDINRFFVLILSFVC